jgi:L-cysteate sulfo-lyase
MKQRGNVVLNRLYGAVLHDVPWIGDRSAETRDLAATLDREGKRPFIVPYGVSDALGAIGYATTALEIARRRDLRVHAHGNRALLWQRLYPGQPGRRR